MAWVAQAARVGARGFVATVLAVLLEQIDATRAPTYYHHDDIGSTRMLTDTSGEPTATFNYAPFGRPTGSTGRQTTPLGFAGQYTDTESGLQYLRARYLDPATGQFMSRDPLEDATGEPYAYADQSPLAVTDPTGAFAIPSPTQVATRLTGVVDALTLEGTARIRGRLGLNGGLDKCSVDYTASHTIGNITLGVDAAVGTLGALFEASPFELRLFERQGKGGLGIINLRDTRLAGDNRLIAVDRHPIPTKAGVRTRMHVDLPQRGIKHWPYP